MGIRGLQSFLEHHGEAIALPQDGTQAWLVIDGCALAYFVWREARLLEGGYRAFATALRLYLKQITDAGAEILQICFDGYLPAHKTGIRTGRLRERLRLVQRNIGTLDQWTPSPGFAAYVAHEVLAEAGYHVTVSEEEADLTCARIAGEFARLPGPPKQVLILSQDSDMHLFNLGVSAAYMPLSSVQFVNGCLHGRAYRYRETSSSLGVDLLELGTLMGTEGSVQAPELPRSSIQKLIRGSLRRYVVQEEILRSANMFDWSTPGPQTAAGLYFSGRRCSGNVMEMVSSSVLYLPQILENTRRESIWLCSRPIRAQAYARIQDLLEPRKHQKHQKSLGVTEWVRDATDLTSQFIACAENDVVTVPPSGLSYEALFITAIQILQADCKAQNRPMKVHELHAFIVMYLGTFPSTITVIDLNVIHLTARYAGLIYSLLLLHECCRVEHVPQFYKLYDLGTFLVALQLLNKGVSLQQLAPGKEMQIQTLLETLNP